MKKFLRIAGALLLTVTLTACQTAPTGATSPENSASTDAAGTTTPVTAALSTSEPSQTESQGQALETEYPYTFTGSSGEEVVIEKEPQRIISLSPTFTEIVFGIGAGDRLVGRTDFCDYPSEASQIHSVGPMIQPSVETIIELEPDVVLVSFMEEEMMDKIRQSGAVIVQIESSNSIEGSYEVMEEIGRVLNVSQQADEVIEGIKTDIVEIARKVEGREPVSVYYVAGFGQFGDYTSGEDTFIHDLIEAAGGVNAGADAEGWNYTAEKLIEKDPEYIIIGTMSAMADEFKATEPYRNLTAVKEDRVLELDDNLITREGPRMAEGVLIMAEIFHSEVFE